MGNNQMFEIYFSDLAEHTKRDLMNRYHLTAEDLEKRNLTTIPLARVDVNVFKQPCRNCPEWMAEDPVTEEEIAENMEEDFPLLA